MGKRKERRLAAMSNTGRRVKLDLFAQPQPQSELEPSGGDLGGSNVHDDDDDVVGGDITDSKYRKASPNSPSSSGQQPQNPLLLLNQYSDDDVDGEPGKCLIHGETDGSITNEEAGGVVEGDSEDIDIIDQKNGHGTVLSSNFLGDQGCDRYEPNAAASSSLQRQLDSSKFASVSGASDVQLASDAGLGWKMVLHEESKQYYYWNTETGETSWEAPQGFSQASLNSHTALAAANDNKSSSLAVETSDVTGSVQTAILDGSSRDTLITPGDGVDGPAFKTDGWREEQKNELVEDGSVGTDAKSEMRRSPDVLDVSHIDDASIKVDSKHEIDEINFPFLLVKMGDILLEKLKSMHELQSHLHCQDSLSKLILEVEIRLSDIKSLACYGKSLFPFWLHSEKHLKNVEMLIGGDKTLPLRKSEHADKVEDMRLSSTEGENQLQRSMDYEFGVDKVEKIVVSTHEKAHVSSSTAVTKEFLDTSAIDAEHGPSPVHAVKQHTVNAEADKDNSLVNGTAPADSTQKYGYNDGDDMDMDVDMEDEYANTSINTAAACPLVSKDSISSEQLVRSSVPVECHSSIIQDHFAIPHPPDEEWIPPPPPDNELEPPPPPPDDPPEALHPLPPSFPEAVQTLVYGEQNGLPYPVANFDYYSHTSTDISNNNLYGHEQGSQITISQPQFYYSAVPGSYPESMHGNHVELEPFYQLPNNATPVVVDRIDSSVYTSESAIVQKSVSSSAVTSSCFVPRITADVPGVDGGADKALIDVPSVSSTIQAPADVNVSAPSIITVPETIATAASLSAAKAQSKAARVKKRTVAVASSLRSNKKVSSLVDKWKAAKEELLEDEEEPETAYEFLERKKQKEIEEWRAKQIASGEAKDNANFQPLGSDWREKVKRKRAQHKSEAIEREKNIESKKQPNLIEISRELPSGWQAYWDESSKQVYYGNPTTSETSWTKPTK